jgi:hypothetical protein
MKFSYLIPVNRRLLPYSFTLSRSIRSVYLNTALKPDYVSLLIYYLHRSAILPVPFRSRLCVQRKLVTPNMLTALKVLCRSRSGTENMPQKTARALEKAGLVRTSRLARERATSDRSPYFACKLTRKGKAFCDDHFGQPLGPDDAC